MGAIKANNYLQEEQAISMLGRAISHPARVKIISKLFEEKTMARSVDLAKWLNFSKPALKDHVDKIKDAGIISLEYFPHYYQISLNSKGMDLAERLLSKGS